MIGNWEIDLLQMGRGASKAQTVEEGMWRRNTNRQNMIGTCAGLNSEFTLYVLQTYINKNKKKLKGKMHFCRKV